MPMLKMLCTRKTLLNTVRLAASYRPPTKLRKGMFSVMSIHHSARARESPCDHYPWCIGPGPSTTPWTSDLGPHYMPPPNMAPYCTGTPCYGHLAAKTGDLFKLVHLRNPPSRCWRLVATEVGTVGKRAIRILLECILVLLLITQNHRAIHISPLWFWRQNII